MATGGRKTQLPLLHELSFSLTPARLTVPAGQSNILLGTLPAGSVLNTEHVVVSQVFNSTTSQLFIGLSAGLGQILSNYDLTALARTDPVVPAAAAGPFLVDQQIWLAVVNTGPAPTQGVATIWLDYLPGPG